MAVERYGSKTDVVVKLVLVFFVSLLSFSIGTFVGKKFSDNQHKLAQFEPEANNERGVASLPPDGELVKPKDALTDDEIAKLAEEFVSDDEKPAGHGSEHEAAPVTDKNSVTHTEAKADHGSGHEPANHGKTTTAETVKHDAPMKVQHTGSVSVPNPAHDDGHTVAQTLPPKHVVPAKEEPLAVAKRVVQGMTPEVEKVAETKDKTRIPQSLPKEVAGSALGKYTVQVASYPVESEAQKMAAELKDKGFSAFYVSAKVKDKASGTEKTWYRVSVGLFNSAKEADAYKKDLLSRAKVTSAIVQKISQ